MGALPQHNHWPAKPMHTLLDRRMAAGPCDGPLRDRPKGSMNLEEVARLAGVSRSTVSRVVNDDPRVSAEVRARVRQIVDTYHYHPNAAARSLASRRTRIIGLLIPHAVSQIFRDPFFPVLVQGAVEACNETDSNLTMLM